MKKHSTLDVWKKEYEKNPVTKKYYTLKRNKNGGLTEIYYIFKLSNHKKEKIYSFSEIIQIMNNEISEPQLQKLRKKIIILGEITVVLSVIILFLAAVLNSGGEI